MAEKLTIDAMWDDSPIDVSTEVNFIWSIANKLRGTYQSDKYKDVIIPMVIIRRFECALAPTKKKVLETFAANPNYPAKAMYRVSGYQFYNTSGFDLAELVNDSEHLAANFKAYIQGCPARRGHRRAFPYHGHARARRSGQGDGYHAVSPECREILQSVRGVCR